MYLDMRAFVPTNRGDPNIAAVTAVFENAGRRRKDFIEARILAAACHLYAGRPKEARTHLDEASKQLTKLGLNPSPFGQDCCLCWLLLNAPNQAAGDEAVSAAAP